MRYIKERDKLSNTSNYYQTDINQIGELFCLASLTSH